MFVNIIKNSDGSESCHGPICTRYDASIIVQDAMVGDSRISHITTYPLQRLSHKLEQTLIPVYEDTWMTQGEYRTVPGFKKTHKICRAVVHDWRGDRKNRLFEYLERNPIPNTSQIGWYRETNRNIGALIRFTAMDAAISLRYYTPRYEMYVQRNVTLPIAKLRNDMELLCNTIGALRTELIKAYNSAAQNLA